MDSSLQVDDVRLQVSSIVLPRHPVHPRSRLFLEAVVALPEQVDCHVVKQRGEPRLPVLPCCLAQAVQPAGPASLARCPVRVRLSRVLLGRRPSLHSLLGRSPAFVRLLRWLYAAVRLPAVVHVGLIAHRVLPPACCPSAPGGNGVSRFSRMEFLCMPGVLRLRRAATHSPVARIALLPSGSDNTVGSRIAYFE